MTAPEQGGGAPAPSARRSAYLRRAVVQLQRPEAWAGGAALFACLVIVSAEIFLRGLLGTSLRWSEELARYLLIWTTYLGAAAVTADNAHIRVEMGINRLRDRARLTLEGIILAASIAATATMAWYGLRLVRDTKMLGLVSGESEMPIEIWVFQAVIPLAFAAMTLRLGLSLLHLLRFGEVPRPEDDLSLEF